MPGRRWDVLAARAHHPDAGAAHEAPDHRERRAGSRRRRPRVGEEPGRDRHDELVVLAAGERRRPRVGEPPRRPPVRGRERQVRDPDARPDVRRAADVAEVLDEPVRHVDGGPDPAGEREARGEAGDRAALPAQGTEAVCRYCEARGLCRKNYWP